MKMDARHQIDALQESMSSHKVDAVIVPSNDPHMSEYPPERYKVRRFMSGFTGSAGTAVFWQDQWGLWADGRYYIQARKEIGPNGGTLFRVGDASCPTIPQHLSETILDGGTVAVNGEICSHAFANELEAALFPHSIRIRYDLALAEEQWSDRPPLAPAPAWSVAAASGKSVREKLRMVREKLSPDATALLTARLDSNAWLFNIRAQDVPYVPAPVAYSLILPEKAVLFIDTGRISAELRDELAADNVELREYDAVWSAVREMPAMSLQMEAAEVNQALWSTAAENAAIRIVEKPNPIPFLKAVKTPEEIEHTKQAYLEDCCALCEFYALLEKRLAGGEHVSEYDAALLLESCRRKNPNYIGPSFAPIIGYRENAAMMHYGPTAQNASRIGKEGFLLVDTGGHYRYGTTDITRTYSFGTLDKEDRRDYTTVIKGFISLHDAVFKDGTPGRELDDLCRVHFWRRRLDYSCGTGHGVGFILNIHEGPHGFGPGARELPLHERMYITVEPGIYREGVRGIRCENAVYVVPYGQSEYGRFLSLDTFTFLPIDPAPLLLDEMDQSELRWLNCYNQRVRDIMLPLLSAEAASWLLSRSVKIQDR